MAVSDRTLPPGIGARDLGEDDLEAALALSREAGWNQVAADWRIFLQFGQVIGLTRGDGPLIATAAMLPHGRDFAWISMVLVTVAERRLGLARWLLRRCVDELVARNLVPLLDATPAGRTVYLNLGFHDCWTMHRLAATAVRDAQPALEPPAATMRAMDVRDWPAIKAYDRTVFGADRSALLRHLAGRMPAAALVAEERGRIVGYLFGRDGRNFSQLGPLVAGTERVAIDLLAHALNRIPGPLAIDLPDRHSALGAWLNARGFKAERPLTRMVYGRSKSFDDYAQLFAIAGPELG